MSDPLAGWRRRAVDGGVLLVGPDPMYAAIRIRTGIPLQPVRALLDEMTAVRLGGAAFEEIGAARGFCTDEGEHAAIAAFVARPGDAQIRRTIAVVVGDSAMLSIDGRVVRPAHLDITAIVRGMALASSLGLGTDRWRRYFYAAPRGWHRLERLHADVWFAPAYPTNPGTITVFHARPSGQRASAALHANVFEKLAAEYVQGELIERRPATTATGLTGERITFRAQLDGQARRATNVVVGDRYVHLLRLETDDAHADANAAILDDVVRSIEPIPPVRTHDAAAFSHYTE
ncbi:MAG: hypothetical protein K8W52_01060 [Deltaproteobacteria bacterium]|nr:hypothetical protein [Deltaproteobacteria bacterium]